MTETLDATIPSSSARRTGPRLADVASTRRGQIALFLVLVYVVAAAVGSFVVDYDPTQTRLAGRLRAPFSRNVDGSLAFLGTDQTGRDVFAQVITGARVSLTVAVVAVIGTLVLGTVAGLVSGYFGGVIDSIVMRIADVQLAFPTILLAILLASVIGNGLDNVIITLIVTRWVGFARVVRSQVLSLRRAEFVESTRVLGARPTYIMRKCVLPMCSSTLVVLATVELGGMILAEASLSFLGLGVPRSTPSWGSTIAAGRDYLSTAWWISTFPGVALTGLVIATGVLGNLTRDLLDPESSKR